MDVTQEDKTELVDEQSEPFVGRWHRLVSTTNWEKGRVICQWREALTTAGASAQQCSDEAWSRQVGGVTGQHVGRLRRVFERFGDVYDQYEGLYWSHFMAALDWAYAEMWLEGAVQSGWSVSQMRHGRDETLGLTSQSQVGSQEGVSAEEHTDGSIDVGEAVAAMVVDAIETVHCPQSPEGTEVGEAGDVATNAAPGPPDATMALDEREQIVSFVRPFENLEDLPEDLNEAFEAFKLAILRHKADGWVHVAREDVLASLDALKQLALAPAGGEMTV
jgi:hypothetical protein